MSLTALYRSSLTARPALRRCLATHAPSYEKDCSSITPPYAQLIEKLERVRELLNNRPLTLAEKILYSHLNDPEKSLSGGGKIRGESYLQLTPQRVAMQDASAQYVITPYYSELFLIALFYRMALYVSYLLLMQCFDLRHSCD